MFVLGGKLCRIKYCDTEFNCDCCNCHFGAMVEKTRNREGIDWGDPKWI